LIPIILIGRLLRSGAIYLKKPIIFQKNKFRDYSKKIGMKNSIVPVPFKKNDAFGGSMILYGWEGRKVES
jgi:hypothetical protein